jgi:uncharacterized repeat protein (TIGR02543 family)
LQHAYKKRILSALLAAALILTLLPAAAFAASAASGTASGTAGYDSISVYLSGGTFSSIAADVTNAGNWMLTGSKTIQSITRQSDTSVKIVLSGVIEPEDTFTLQALPAVFAEGTDPFESPIAVTIYVPYPAQGTAAAAAGTKDITVTLTNSNFHSQARVEDESYWILGGASAADNPIASVSFVDICNAKVTLTNNIGLEDVYTIQISPFLLPNVMTTPFVSPLEVQITGDAPSDPSADSVCSIGSTEYPTLAAALAAVTDATPTTIVILTDIDHQSAVNLVNKNITFDLNGHTVSIATSEIAETALNVNGGSLCLNGAGALNVTGLSHGVRVSNYADVTVTNATVTGGSGGNAAAANTHGSLVVLGNATATSYPDCAALASFSGSVTVNGNAQSVWMAACADQQGTVYIKGNATATATSTDGAGAFAFSGGKITIDGDITADRYIKVGNTVKGIGDKTLPSTKPGYHAYTDGTSTVWVKDTATYTVTFDSQNGSFVADITGVTPGSTVNMPLEPTRPGYRFGGWYKESACTDAWDFSTDTVTENITLYAKWTYNGSGGSGGGDNGSGGNTPATPTYKADVSGIGTATATIPVNVDTGTGNATADLGTMAADNMLDAETAVITVPSIPGVNSYTLGIPAASLSGSQGEGTLTFSTGSGSIIIPAGMLAGIPGTEGKKAGITIAQGDKSGLPDNVKAAIGDRPIVKLTMTLDGTPAEWNNPNAPVTISIPYTPTAEELANPESIIIWYIDGNGNVVEVPSGRYDPATGTVIFSTTHFSEFAVVYVKKTFDDLGIVVWARKPIEALASKGILKGTSETEYAPQTNITRADFLYFLVRTLGVDAKFSGNFDDIDKNAYYYKEIGIAKELGITSGTGNNEFTPDASITRQDMMVLTERALRMLKKLEAQGTVSDLDKFADKSLVADYAVNGVASVVREGLIIGSGGKVNPLGNTTRAEAAVFLYRIYGRYPG